MQQLMQQNIVLNDLQANVEASVYDWGGKRPEHIPLHPKVVLCAGTWSFGKAVSNR